MRKALAMLLFPLAIAGCGKGSTQADALDRAAAQSDPAAAAALRNQADQIRSSGSDANMSAADSPAQAALQNAGNVAAENTTSTARPERKPGDPTTGLNR